MEKEKKPYERTNYRLPYTHPKGLENARPQPRAPYAVRRRRLFVVNDDPHKLDAMYTKLFGREMELPDEVKWQAITHKSFDHGRQPFNSKLRFLGKRMLQMHVSFHLLSSPPKVPKTPKRTIYKSLEGEVYQDPEPFVHEDYKSLLNVERTAVDAALDEASLMPLIQETGLVEVMRWKPAETNDLERSGQRVVAVECLYAIVGAVALQKGGDVAGQFIRTRILKRSS